MASSDGATEEMARGRRRRRGGGRGNRRSCASPLVGAVRFSFYAREARTFTPVAVDVI